MTFTSLSYGAEPETLPEGITECKFWWVARCCCCCCCGVQAGVYRSVRTPAHPCLAPAQLYLHWHLICCAPLFWCRGMGSDGTVGANKEAVKIIANQEGMFAQVRWAAGPGRATGSRNPATMHALN